MNRPLISVIVPVYKTEQYVGECIESILDQTFFDFELILVDDGSPDNSGAICDEYAARDKRIRVIHKKNDGVSAARNTGIQASKGEWLYFCDSDDTMPPHALASLIYIAGNLPSAQLVVGKVIRNGEIFWQPDVASYSYLYDLHRELDRRNLIDIVGWSPCAKIVRGDIVRDNNIFFDTEICYGEDTLWNFILCKYLSFVACCDEIVYDYRFNENSASYPSDYTRIYCSLLKLVQNAISNMNNPPRYHETCYVLHYLKGFQCIGQGDVMFDHNTVRRTLLDTRSVIIRSSICWVVKYVAIYITLPGWLISNKLFGKIFYNQPVKLVALYRKR